MSRLLSSRLAVLAASLACAGTAWAAPVSGLSASIDHDGHGWPAIAAVPPIGPIPSIGVSLRVAALSLPSIAALDAVSLPAAAAAERRRREHGWFGINRGPVPAARVPLVYGAVGLEY